jgi:hypothetical protein
MAAPARRRVGRRWRQVAGILCAVPGVVLLGIIVAIPVSRSLADQSVMVEAETATFAITLAGNDTSWGFDTAWECAERAIPDFTAAPVPGSPCDPVYFAAAAPGPWGRTFVQGETVHLAIRADGRIAIDLGPQSAEVPGLVVVVAPETWRMLGAVAFDGALRLGEVPGTGTRTYLRSGRYEIRERLPLQSGTNVVKAGDLALGEAVTIRARSTAPEHCLPADGAPVAPCEALVFGHATLERQDGENIFHVLAVSRAGAPELHVSYAGALEPRVLRTTWIDGVLTNPTLLGVAVIMAFVTGAIPLMLEGYRIATGGEDEDGEEAEPAPDAAPTEAAPADPPPQPSGAPAAPPQSSGASAAPMA